MGRTNWEGSDEETLVIAAQAGDLAAFDILAQRYRQAAVTVARQTLPREVAEDAAQDSLLSAYKALPKLEDPRRFAAWFGAIVRHRARRLGRERSREPLALDEVIAAYAPSIVARLHEDERSKQVHCAVSALSEEIREPTELHYMQGWTAPQIAEFLLLPLSTVKWRLYTARRLLRNRLAALEEIE
ncbi:MAG: RNA polymerase sigma factor [Fimbriimonadales bacterium]